MDTWVWIVVCLIALVVVVAFGSLGQKGRRNMDINRRTGKGALDNFDEEQNFIDKYSQ